MNNDLGGAMQDELARLRYALAKAREGTTFDDCRTPFAIYRRLLELDDRPALEGLLAESLRQFNPGFRDAQRWVDQLVPFVEHDDEQGFSALHQRALTAVIFSA